MEKGETPMARIAQTMRLSRLKQPRRKWMRLSLLRKCPITKTAPTAMEMTVAIAAPRIPISKTKMKIGSRMMFITAPANIVSIAFLG